MWVTISTIHIYIYLYSRIPKRNKKLILQTVGNPDNMEVCRYSNAVQ